MNSNQNHRTDQHGDFVYHLPNTLLLTDRTLLGGKDRRIPLYFAADFTDALPQTYQTELIVEFAFSADNGTTIAQSITQTVDLQATVPSDDASLNWLVNRVQMRPALYDCDGMIAKLADSNQEQFDWSDSGWTYDQALAIMAFSLSGDSDEARLILNALRCLQNDDGSWFFSYATSVTDEMIVERAASRRLTNTIWKIRPPSRRGKMIIFGKWYIGDCINHLNFMYPVNTTTAYHLKAKHRPSACPRL